MQKRVTAAHTYEENFIIGGSFVRDATVDADF